MRPTTLLPPALLLLIHSASATFSLNDTGPYWSYTARQLSPTTDRKCLTAYSAPIACTETLLGLVTSLRPGFQPTRDDLSSLCTLGCKSALEDYVQNVGSACGAKGDLATQQAVKSGKNNTYVHVWVVGQMFEYTYAQSCAKDGTNNFCPLTSTTLPSAAANCSSPCSVAFYTNAHDFAPASQKQFQDSYLATQTAYWIKRFNLGYRALVACGEAVGNANRTGSAGAATGVGLGARGWGCGGGYGDDGFACWDKCGFGGDGDGGGEWEEWWECAGG
ncbi:hypothetical protein HO173_011756 [Letharia columbiana]|uniref:Uncharacterized protein n=1 Tax=Letharia columbiana TaxID=112416 RepID=A0A8H6CSK0_9LECA|nr:uncharacterized protein HO173_011756 [Letharia columbiana]KAF6228737.1 hypothetical protein HO173_011756 [Letharia columbiana]